ncbi:hypothetical protein Smp_119260 [Schistosoma mansoni]|uniref:hypothetical protein n=1 Tax=Schistosoma mansoni TaxID=6183 RepID=UPI00022DC5E2|nr:hypothetical protein Smp_119260 [Schistosoma mansoni]|eukprot:XP_018648749.1 hypothetical protein Smp_119260 [Schistosoma mansoni]
MAFEWRRLTHKNFGYVYLLQNVPMWIDETVKVYKGDIGLLKAIGQACVVSNYRAEGYTNDFLASNFMTYHMTYKRGELFLNSYQLSYFKFMFHFHHSYTRFEFHIEIIRDHTFSVIFYCISCDECQSLNML